MYDNTKLAIMPTLPTLCDCEKPDFKTGFFGLFTFFICKAEFEVFGFHASVTNYKNSVTAKKYQEKWWCKLITTFTRDSVNTTFVKTYSHLF